MRIGYYIAKPDEFRGNCIRLAGRAQLLWENRVGFALAPKPLEGARIVEFDDGTTLRQLLMLNADGELQFLDVD